MGRRGILQRPGALAGGVALRFELSGQAMVEKKAPSPRELAPVRATEGGFRGIVSGLVLKQGSAPAGARSRAFRSPFGNLRAPLTTEAELIKELYCTIVQKREFSK